MDHRGHAAAAATLGIFRPADQAVIGGHLEERERRPRTVGVQVFDLGYFHLAGPSRDVAYGLRHSCTRSSLPSTNMYDSTPAKAMHAMKVSGRVKSPPRSRKPM